MNLVRLSCQHFTSLKLYRLNGSKFSPTFLNLVDNLPKRMGAVMGQRGTKYILFLVNIKFTREDASDNTLPFLHCLLSMERDGSPKAEVYRKTVQTDQCILFDFHHLTGTQMFSHQIFTPLDPAWHHEDRRGREGIETHQRHSSNLWIS